MMSYLFRCLLALSVCLFISPAYSAGTAVKADASGSMLLNYQQRITTAFQKVRPDWQLQSITASPMAGLYEVQVVDGPLIYSSADGQFFVAGDLYQITDQGFVNIAESKREVIREKALAEVSINEMIVFPAVGPSKAHITVFTDIDCGYCRKLHKEVPTLNAMGIEVRYMAYPRAGIGSKSYQKIATAWCAENPREALTDLKNGKTLAMNVCAANPVAKHYALGQRIGVTGTPAIVTESGKLLPGYMPAKQLAAAIGLKP